MEIFWQQTRKGQRLVLDLGQEGQAEIGGVRETKRGFDAFAQTFGYDPGRAVKGMATMEEAKAFVESFRPWELYQGTDGLSVDPDVRLSPG